MNIKERTIKSAVEAIHAKTFQNKHKANSKNFSRNRKLCFANIVSMLLRLVKNSIQIECNFFGDLMKIDPATKQAFSQARNKLQPSAFQELHEGGLRVFYTHKTNEGLWQGYRIIACDGSTSRLPNSKELEIEFGRYPTKDGNGPVMSRISEFTDVTTKLVLSAPIAPYSTSEGKLAEEQLIEVTSKMKTLNQKKLLFIYDRGYPSAKFINQHVELGVDFVFRLPKAFDKATSEIANTDEVEGFVLREGSPLLRIVKIPLST